MAIEDLAILMAENLQILLVSEPEPQPFQGHLKADNLMMGLQVWVSWYSLELAHYLRHLFFVSLQFQESTDP